MVCGICECESEYTLCWDHLATLRRNIVGLSAVVDELETTLTRQAVGAPSVGTSGNEEKSLPFDLGASRAYDAVRYILLHWYRMNRELFLPEKASDQTKYLADWHLTNYMNLTVAGVVNVTQMYRDFERALINATAAIDTRASRIWLGECDCGRTIRSYRDTSTVLCKCGILYDVQKRRADFKILGAEQIVSARDIEELGDLYGVAIKQSTVRSWKARGKLLCIQCGKDAGVCMSHIYRFGDVLDLQRKVSDA